MLSTSEPPCWGLSVPCHFLPRITVQHHNCNITSPSPTVAFSPPELNDDVLIEIANQLKASSCDATLSSFSLVNKRCYDIGQRALYRNIFLTESTLDRFMRCFNAANYSSHVRSVTVRVRRPPGIEPWVLLHPFRSYPALQALQRDSQQATLLATALSDKIGGFAKVMPSFENLASFSMRFEEWPFNSVSRLVLAELLSNLPESCVHLELDTCGQDYREENENIHLCDIIRGLLPRMLNVRLRLGAMCGGMFITWNPEHTVFTAVDLSKLKSVVINCTLLGDKLIQRCGPTDKTALAKYLRSRAWADSWAWGSMNATLERSIALHGTAEGRRICVIGNVYGEDYDTSLRVNFESTTGMKVWAFPSFWISYPLFCQTYLVPLPDGRQILADPDEVEALAEERVWQTASTGIRLPRDLFDAAQQGLPSFASGIHETGFGREVADWVRLHNETILEGQSVVAGEMTQTGDSPMNLRPIPDESKLGVGWYCGENGVLERVITHDYSQHT
ncbi:hypothetical protein M011DRAFT_50175 [Sporormia fimetaria CBS 119925]|uniref:Uncharacterized protein n=1 Tax=Sporormia fimetaria CBS 119925 TaxID=1340428 RepID=A0A6A6VAM0_9PLEO|nr:hypothetical protein M011DRAFT_50175 [Sporormia fimetaria CBS 119925]